ncbi:MAG: hypothetical protein ABL888_10990, partial [Pirellulaceae bacterium]
RNDGRQIAAKRTLVAKFVVENSGRFQDGWFSSLRTDDLEIMFTAIDKFFLDGWCQQAINSGGHLLDFRLGKRMTHCGGKTTTRIQPRTRHQKQIEIAISPRLLHESFETQSEAYVTGVVCHSPLDAFARIMEHEMLHLLEMVLWNDSSCAKKRFKGIANGMFGHRESTHRLLTPSQIAQKRHQITIGSQVIFKFREQTLTGVVNRIDRRATVLVPNPNGLRFTDGKRYNKFYVPVTALRTASQK